MKVPKLKTAMIIAVVTVTAMYGFGCRMIYNGVRNMADYAQEAHEGESAVGALIALVEDERAPFPKRNSAIWALGQIGDKRALPTLLKLDTAEIEEPPYDSTTKIVQYGVEKAIKQINGFSVVRWMYRGMD